MTHHKKAHIPDQINGMGAFKHKIGDTVKTVNGRGTIKERSVHPKAGGYENMYVIHINGVGDLVYFEFELKTVVL